MLTIKQAVYRVVGLEDVLKVVAEMGGDADSARWRVYDGLGVDTDLARGRVDHALLKAGVFASEFFGGEGYADLREILKSLGDDAYVDLEG